MTRRACARSTTPARRFRDRGALVALALLAGCDPLSDLLVPDEAPDVTARPAHITPSRVARVPLDALMPTDLRATDDGWAVLDGLRQTVLFLDRDGAPIRTVGGSPAWGQPVRMALDKAGGIWLADPGGAARDGHVLRVGESGEIDLLLPLPAVAIRIDGDSILWSDRDSGLHRVSIEGRPLGDVGAAGEVDGAPYAIGLVVDLDGALAVDTLAPGIAEIGGAEARFRFGRFGTWHGTLRKPKSATRIFDVVAVADSAHGSVEVFTEDGTALGALAHGSSALTLRHPVAVRAHPAQPGRIAVLDEASPELVLLDIPEAELARARAVAAVRALRTAAREAPLAEADACFQCHDGFVFDSRRNWDASREHHPVGIVPDRALPSVFPLQDGRIACSTCHAAHGEVEAAEAAATTGEGGRRRLVAHGSADRLFLRMQVADSSLCAACHEGAHGGGVYPDVPATGSHPVGPALADALRARPGSKPGEDASSCLGCHAPHGASGEALLRRDDAGGTCVGCHESEGRPHGNHPIAERLPKSALGPARMAWTLARGDELSCRTCHDLASTAESLLRPGRDGAALCVDCHGPAEVPHDAHSDLPCLRCHDPHGGDPARSLLRYAAREGDATGCSACHAPDDPGPVRPGGFGHPVQGGEGERAILGCGTCHDRHLGKPVPACASCHAEEGAAAERGGHGDAACTACHPPHRATRPVPASARASNPASQACLTCHAFDARGDATSRVGTWDHPEAIFLPDGNRWAPLGDLPLFGPDGEVVPHDESGTLTCQSCHETHGPAEADRGDKLRRPKWQGACSACHGDDALVLYRFFHRPDRRRGVRP
jgi:predicted CXXCH cytochrome family protein